MAQAEGKATARERQSQVERLHILDDDEWDALYGRPRFTSAEQAEYFSLSGVERAALDEFHSFKSKLCLVLQLGYFKARRLFFRFDLPEVEADASFIRDRYFPDFRLLDVTVTKVTRLRQQRLILELCGYHRCLPHERRQLETKARQTARVWSQPVYLLRELLATLAEQRIMTLGYRFLQDTVSQALAFEQDRLITLTRNALTPSDREALQQLLADAPGLYELTQLKREPRDFSVGEIKREIQRGIQLRPLFRVAQGLLPGLGISSESVKYYASLVGYYSVHRLKQLNEWLVAVYLLCFVHHRYQRLNDHLIQSLIHKVRRYGEEAKAAAKEKVYAAQVENHHNLHQAGRVLKLFTDDTIAGTTPFAEVRASAFTILERPKLDLVADHITAQARLDETAFQWEELDRLAAQFKLHLRPILENVELSAISAQAPLLRAIDFLKTALGKNRSLGQTGSPAFPLRFISETMKRYLFTTDLAGRKQVLPNRYEFLVYRSVRHGLEAGDIFCRDSVRFRSFEDDLVTDHQWQEKDRLLADAGLTSLTQPIREHLQALEQQLESRLTEVNRRIANGENEHFQVTRRGPHPHWTLRYPRHAETVNHAFFDRLAQVEIGNLLQFINQQCPFLDVFDHVLGRYTKQAADSSLLLAALIAWATNLGPGRMSEISDLDAHRLITTSDNFIRLETLRAANDRLSQALAQLPVFTHYHLGDRLHSSSDGQKFETRSDTFNARHSPKYFGLKKGVVASTLVANHIPLNAKVIGAHEHESHYVFDLLFNNSTDIQPDIHSTDTHGTNEVNFAILHSFGYQFAPRYKDIRAKISQSLYGFRHPSQYGDVLIKPIRKIKTDLIIEDWDKIQRIFASLAVKTTTQSIIVSKLSAYARKNKTRRALWEYDNILRSLYLLDYIDSPPLRQNVQQALNRGESYHKLRRAVSFANFGKLRFRTESDQQIWSECSRLLTNCIIFYNATILSNLLRHKEAAGDQAGVAALAQVSPVAWQHINLHGRYEFTSHPAPIDMEAIIQTLTRIPLSPP